MRYSRRILLQSVLAILMTGPVHGRLLEDCSFNGKDVNLDNGAETAGITGTVRCKDRQTGALTREIP
jgi:hypothetical protein